MPNAASCLANSTMPVLSETEISARWIFILDLEGYSRNVRSSIEKLAHQSLNAPH